MVWEEDDDEEQVTTEYLEEVVKKPTSFYRSQTAENFTNLQQILILTELIPSRKCSKEICRALEEDIGFMQKEQQFNT
jgi:hypothetical protein